jgi:D-beta-D-heptose 7-phosphate kinase / D-beta-D-heptose 1-phosphate adenosyltransferase
VLKVKEEFQSPGGAANVALNLKALGSKVALIGVTGKDTQGDILRDTIKLSGLSSASIVRDHLARTTVKSRLMASNQQITRIDYESEEPLSTKAERALIGKIEKAVAGNTLDAIIISDYAKGALTNKVLSHTIKLARKKGILTVVDPKGEDFRKYRGADVITPNKSETEAASGIEITDIQTLSAAVKGILKLTGAGCVLITRGREGITYCRKGGRPTTVKSIAKEVYDVTGAGDTVVSAFTLAYAASGTLGESVGIANAAAGITVGRLGASQIESRELIEHFVNPGGPESKIHSPETLAKKLAAHRSRGNKVVFTNGCFDLFHTGHLKLLTAAARLGDVLVVAINTDRSVKKLKGSGRPFVSETDRVKLLSALDCVSYLTVFSEETPLNLIKRLRPDVLVKGGDYRAGDVVGGAFVKSSGGRVKIIPLVKGISTTTLAGKIKKD